MSDENPDDLIVIYSPGIEELPNGSSELKVEAPTEVHHVTRPETLCIGKRMLCKCYWNSGTKYTIYRTGWDTIEEAMRQLM